MQSDMCWRTSAIISAKTLHHEGQIRVHRLRRGQGRRFGTIPQSSRRKRGCCAIASDGENNCRSSYIAAKRLRTISCLLGWKLARPRQAFETCWNDSLSGGCRHHRALQSAARYDGGLTRSDLMRPIYSQAHGPFGGRAPFSSRASNSAVLMTRTLSGNGISRTELMNLLSAVQMIAGMIT